MMTSTILILTALSALLLVSLGLALGALIMLLPGRRQPETDSTLRGVVGVLDHPWEIERWIYRHHRAVGATIILAAGFCVWQLATIRLTLESAWIHHWAVWIDLLILAQCLNGLVGLLMIVRPSLLKPVESISNRWRSLAPRKAWSRRTRASLLALVALIAVGGTAGLIVEILSGSI